MTRIQMDFRVTVLVDVADKRPSHLREFADPMKYAKAFVSLSPAIYGSHLIDVQGGRGVDALEVVSTNIEPRVRAIVLSEQK